MKDSKYLDPEGIYIHPGKPPFDYLDGSEEYLLKIFKEQKDIKSYSPELLRFIKDWSSRYHLSLQRTNLLDAIAELFHKNTHALELGSGCGAISRWLGEHFQNVDAIEGSLMRSKVTRERTRDLANVKVYCADMLKVSFQPHKYGLVTLIGVLEYVPYYLKAKDPKEACINFLKNISAGLEEDGVLLIAIENKLGAKYFTGCTEDHTARLFDGLIDYPGNSPVTLSRDELHEILRIAGFENEQFYHVFPDYKLPNTFFMESQEILSLNPYNWIGTPFEDYIGERLYILPEPLFLKTLTKSRLLWQFSNSFLVLASKSKKRDLRTSWLIKKFFNNDVTKPVYHHTIDLRALENSYIIRREPIYFGQAFIKNSEVEFTIHERSDFIHGELLQYEIYSGLMSDDPDGSLRLITKRMHENLLRNYYTNGKDEELFHLVGGEAVDYTFWNLIARADGNLEFIDKKWKYDRSIPADFVLFRSLFYLHLYFSPFIEEKDISRFIIGIISSVYPFYNIDRLRKNVESERFFQSEAATSWDFDLGTYSPQYSAMQYFRNVDTILKRLVVPESDMKAIDNTLIKKIEELQNQIKGLENLKNSLSWRVTAPLRWLKEKISG